LNLLNQITDYELNKIQIQKYFNYYNNLKEYEVENLICIVRLNEVWEYMECQGVPKFVSISFLLKKLCMVKVNYSKINTTLEV